MINAKLITQINSDLKVVNAARVSMAKQHTDFDSIADPKLINYLGSHGHWTPFSHNRDVIIFKLSSKVMYYNFNEMLTVDLSLDEKASLVIQKIVDNGIIYMAVKTSLYGWSKIAHNLDKTYMSSDGDTVDRILSVIYTKYPHSTKSLIGQELIDKYQVNPNKYFSNNDLISKYIHKFNTDMFDVTFYETVPIFVARQRFKHMIGFTYNEVSRRYVDDLPELFTPNEWRQRPDKSIKQGSGDICKEQDTLKEEYDAFSKMCLEYYNKLIDKNGDNVAPEMARMILPQSMMTKYFVTGNLSAWERLIKQRVDNHAQLEIQDLAKIVNIQLQDTLIHVNQIRQSGSCNIPQLLENLGVF